MKDKMVKKVKRPVEKHLPRTWAKMFGLSIMDPDGWREDGKNFNLPIGKKEFIKRMTKSTIISKMESPLWATMKRSPLQHL